MKHFGACVQMVCLIVLLYALSVTAMIVIDGFAVMGNWGVAVGRSTTFQPTPPPTVVPHSCDDGIRNGDETDVDCGSSYYAMTQTDPLPGTPCPRCNITQSCCFNWDCADQMDCTHSFEENACHIYPGSNDPSNPHLGTLGECVECTGSHCHENN